MGPRANLAITLAVAGIVLLVAIAVGNQMGNHVLGQATERGPAILATPVATPVGADTSGPDEANWRHNQIVSVATDPAFPDPRVTPEPPPPPPTPPPYKPTAEPTPEPSPTASRPPYTSPPLPIPIVSHTPDENATGEVAPTASVAPTKTPR